jgi:N,N'-diacetyllegionaminate synthase
MKGPDHKASLEPIELKAMVQSIRNVELALAGTGIKVASNSEKKNIGIARKSIVAARNISIGDTFTDENITVKRPGIGINPMLWDEVIGKKAVKDFKEDELIVI